MHYISAMSVNSWYYTDFFLVDIGNINSSNNYFIFVIIIVIYICFIVIDKIIIL